MYVSPAHEELRDALVALADANQPATVRQLYYLATVANLVPKTETGYGLVQRQLVILRDRGRIPFDQIVDNTRRSILAQGWDSPADAMDSLHSIYRLNYWKDQPRYVEIWLEKDALSGVIEPITRRYRVPLRIARGYSSVTFLHTSAMEIAEKDKPAEILLLGDCDPSGHGARQSIMGRLREFAPDVDMKFSTIALTQTQVAKWNVPTRPTKTTDTRSTNWRGESAELDAIPPPRLRELVENSILRRIDWPAWNRSVEQEKKDKAVLLDFVESAA